MNVLLVASESVPFVKTGGLADVVSALGRELINIGVDARIIIPYHGKIKNTSNDFKYIDKCYVRVGQKQEYCGIMTTVVDGVTYYFVDNDFYFGYRVNEIYGCYDDGERYAFFCRAVLESLNIIDFKPDVIHVNDWHSAIIPYLLKVDYKYRIEYSKIKTLLSIHNLQFQGIFPKSLSNELCTPLTEDIIFDDCINYLKAGIVVSDHVVTVSETYRFETLTDYYGERLNHVLNYRGVSYSGIVNGIDYEMWNPKTDHNISFNYDVDNVSDGKKINKDILRKRFNLPISDKPLIGIVSRLSEQKGLDLVKHAFNSMIESIDCQFIVLGSGDREFEEFFREKTSQYNDVASYIGYDEELAHQVYAGCDYYLMPSRFEPCGLSQLISIRYGTIPIVRETGGLKDTVIPYNNATKEGFGYTFCSYNSDDMLDAISRAVRIYGDKKLLNTIRKNMMKLDYSFKKSAEEYLFQYNKIMKY